MMRALLSAIGSRGEVQPLVFTRSPRPPLAAMSLIRDGGFH